MDTVTQLASDMRVYTPEHLLVGNYLYGTWDANLIKQLVSLMAPDVAGMRIDLRTSEYEQLTQGLEASFEVRCVACFIKKNARWGLRTPAHTGLQHVVGMPCIS